MAVYSVEGKLGTGKTKFCVWRAQEALRAGRRVASNVDLVPDKLTPEKPRPYIRLPDKPSPDDLVAIGHGNPDSYDEEKNGVLILDELGTWLNSRTFQDKSRAGVLDWLIHARKLGWDVYLIVQDAGMIDKQVREALIEYQCKCMRMDKVRVPVIGKILGNIFGGRVGYLPRFHLVTARVGQGTTAVVAERWTYRGDELHAAYDTRQIFRADYPHGVHSVLPAWSKPVPARSKLADLVDTWRQATKPAARPKPRPRLAVVDAIARTLPPDERIRHVQRLARLGLI